MNLPNALTFFRIFLIPFFVLVFYLPFNGHYIVTALVFALAGFTDWLDGYLARKLSQHSALGEFLDPVADKLVVTAALILLVQALGSIWLAVPAVIIVGREITISALREWMAELGNRHQVRVSYLGKLKTTGQMVAIVLLLLSQDPSMPGFITPIGYGLIYAAALLTLWSMVNYLRLAWDFLNKA